MMANKKKLGFLAPITLTNTGVRGHCATVDRHGYHKTKILALMHGRRVSSIVKRGAVMIISNETKSTEDNTVSQETQHRLTVGERARTLVHICRSATLCTASVRHEGIPFGSHVDFVQDGEGRPVFLLAKDANHTRNLLSEPRCSLFCQPTATSGQDGCRATLVGSVSPLEGDDVNELQELYIETHLHATEALRFADLFGFYRMQVNDVLFVAGYGVTSQWVSANEFLQAQPDPLAFDAPSIVARLNETKEADLRRLCNIFLGVEDVITCTMVALDRLGFDLRVRDENAQIREFRVGFREAVSNRFDVQSALVKAFQEAWERENGFDETWEGEDIRPAVLYYGRG